MDNPDLDAAFAEAMDGLAAKGLPERAMTELDRAIAKVHIVAFSALILVLIFRPSGILGERLARERA